MITIIAVAVVTIAVIIIILIIILVIIIVTITECWDPVPVRDLQRYYRSKDSMYYISGSCKDAEAVQMGHVRVSSSQLCWVTRLSTFRRHSTTMLLPLVLSRLNDAAGCYQRHHYHYT